MTKHPIVGIPEIDSAHREIFFLLVQLSKLDGNLDKIYRIFEDYTNDHFKMEETFLTENKYPLLDLEEHKKDHIRLRSLFLSSDSISKEFLEDLGLQISSHINFYDSAMANWLYKKREDLVNKMLGLQQES